MPRLPPLRRRAGAASRRDRMKGAMCVRSHRMIVCDGGRGARGGTARNPHPPRPLSGLVLRIRMGRCERTRAGRAPGQTWVRVIMSEVGCPRRGVRRGAMAGLAIGLAALAALTIGGTLSTRQATAQVRASNQITSAWGTSSSRSARRTRRCTSTWPPAPSSTGRAADGDRVGGAGPGLAVGARRDDEAFQVALLRHDYVRYENSLRAIHDAGGTQRQAEIDANVSAGRAGVRRAAPAVGGQRRAQAARPEQVPRAVDRRNRTLQSLAGRVFASTSTFWRCASRS
jgi:hypothetical protein